MAHQNTSTSERGIRESGPFSRSGNLIGAHEEITQARKRDNWIAYAAIAIIIALAVFAVLFGIVLSL